MIHCLSCQSTRAVKNGRIHSGKQNHKCRDCLWSPLYLEDV
ncbi:IS1 family transposase [[Leptolyngbya] sp. PCC 7376]